MDEEAARKTIVEALQKKKGKSKFYLKDFYSMLPDEKNRAVKNLVNKMLEYWSSGSTTLIGLKGVGKQAHGEGED